MKKEIVMILLVALVGAGCATTPLQRDATLRKASGFGRKSVSAKRDPIYLIAIDGTECSVSTKRYAKVKVGDNVFCLWSSPTTAF